MSTSHDRRALLVLGDWLVSACSFLLAVRLRFGPDFRTVWEVVLGLPPIVLFTPVLAVATTTTFSLAGVYRAEARWSVRIEVVDVIRATALTALLLMSALYFFRLEDVSRRTLAGFLAGLAGGAIAMRLVVQRWAPQKHRLRVLLVGTDGAQRIVDSLTSAGRSEVELVGFLGHETQELANSMDRIGDLMELPEVLAHEIVDEVIVCLPVEEWRRLDEIAGVCEEQGKVMRVPVDVVAYSLRKGRVEDLAGVPLLSLVSGPVDHISLAIKRIIDILVSVTVLVISLPIVFGIGAALLATQGRPVFFAQERGGINGRPIRVWKYRTMVTDAEALKSDLQTLNERVGPAFKITNDPRVTPLGRWLRKTSLDELPQLWNVLRGDMSLVGPRPQPISEVAAYDPWHRRRLSVKPGITGLWQVTSRHDPSFDHWVDLDLEYIDRWSVWLDLEILARTPAALIRTPGE